MHTDKILLRPFVIEDAPIILGWCKDKHTFRLWSADRYKGYPATLEEMRYQYQGKDKFPLTMIEDRKIVGHILLRYPTNDTDIIRFCFIIVDDTLRNKGYGKKLLELAIDYTQERLHARKITLGVFCENRVALECYKSVGFRVSTNDSYIIDGEEWNGYEMELMLKR